GRPTRPSGRSSNGDLPNSTPEGLDLNGGSSAGGPDAQPGPAEHVPDLRPARPERAAAPRAPFREASEPDLGSASRPAARRRVPLGAGLLRNPGRLGLGD